MPTKQGSIDLVNDPVAQRLLHSSIPARLAYNWTDGTPRVIPVAFHWNGQQIVIGTPSSAPKLKALHDGEQAKTLNLGIGTHKEMANASLVY